MYKKTIVTLLSSLLFGVAGASAQDVSRLRDIMEAVQKGNTGALDERTRDAVQAGLESGRAASQFENSRQTDLESVMRLTDDWQKLSREAFIATIPKRDQALGRSLLLEDGTDPNFTGQVFIFVSRSMPTSLLKAYALDALHLGATLVTKGIKPGQSVPEYVEEAMAEFNTAEGQALSGMDLNPNLFETFGVTVVPTIVWSNKVGLNELGVGCPPLPQETPMPKITLKGPDGNGIEVDKPTCGRAADTSYYKVSGTLNLNYVFDRFEAAGAPSPAMQFYKNQLAGRTTVYDKRTTEVVGNAQVPIEGKVTLDKMPRYVLEHWKAKLAEPGSKVAKSLWGPVFGGDVEEDAQYRAELQERIRSGLAD